MGQLGWAVCVSMMTNFSLHIREQKKKCSELTSIFKSNRDECPPHFDGKHCWPSTPIDSAAKLPCPIPYYANRTLTRECMPSSAAAAATMPNDTADDELHFMRALWSVPVNHDCAVLKSEAARNGNDALYLFGLVHHNPEDFGVDNTYVYLSILDQVGYALSTFFLLVALFIFFRFKHLREDRVKIHANLFVAMLLRSVAALVQNSLYTCEVFYLLLFGSSESTHEYSNFCRALVTMGHYTEISIYTWLFLEGWYFYSYISRSPFDSISMRGYYWIGWGLPIFSLMPWFITYLLNTTQNYCWIDSDEHIFYIAVPILLIIMMECGLFLYNVRFMYFQMKKTYCNATRMMYWKWIKASMMLVPLFGSYNIFYAIWPWFKNLLIRLIFLSLARFICAFQGCIVSTLYCFTNHHVRVELERFWNNWKIEREILRKSRLGRSTDVLHSSRETITVSRFNSSDSILDTYI
ncbi:hypothetical protein TKK_0004895 [Trichogramma kaykai]|uniref:G-protein coupled receptors family 2 profile 2 domain-containing protein n=1 Tax=Trichogramma kaykai TaxID=54128 RepID=A0ABD2XJ89_9HYME